MTNQREYRTVVLAALLHDIGKYLHRGDFGGMVSGPHPEVGANLLRAHAEAFGQCVDAEVLTVLVQRHHESRSFAPELQVDSIADEHLRALARLVSRSDNLASAERGERAEGMQDYRTTCLAPVFSRVQLLGSGASVPLHLPQGAIGDLRAEPPVFPQEGRHGTREEVTDHIRAFGRAFESLRGTLPWDDFDCVFSHLLALLNGFASCIASDTQSQTPDVSLYDHLRLTAAIAACLYLYHEETGTLTDSALKAKDQPERFVLLVGDVSGIQDYLFDIASTGAGGVARRLRARSF